MSDCTLVTLPHYQISLGNSLSLLMFKILSWPSCEGESSLQRVLSGALLPLLARRWCLCKYCLVARLMWADSASRILSVPVCSEGDLMRPCFQKVAKMDNVHLQTSTSGVSHWANHYTQISDGVSLQVTMLPTYLGLGRVAVQCVVCSNPLPTCCQDTSLRSCQPAACSHPVYCLSQPYSSSP